MKTTTRCIAVAAITASVLLFAAKPPLCEETRQTKDSPAQPTQQVELQQMQPAQLNFPKASSQAQPTQSTQNGTVEGLGIDVSRTKNGRVALKSWDCKDAADRIRLVIDRCRYVNIESQRSHSDALRIYNSLDNTRETIGAVIAAVNNGIYNPRKISIFVRACRVWPLIKFHAERLGVDPKLAFLIAMTETRFDDKIVGIFGERSIWQLLPRTEREMERKYGDSDQFYGRGIGEFERRTILALYCIKECADTAGIECSDISGVDRRDF